MFSINILILGWFCGRKETKEMRTSSAGEMRSTREGDGATTSIMNL
jgi:hypothetical protein